MKKKITAIALVVCMLAIAIAGATMAYFTDTESANNVMTVGEIDIEQIETDKDGKPFEDGQHLLPNVTIDKIVTVENVGRSDAFVRTLIAFEGTKEFVEGKLDVSGDIINDDYYVGQITVNGEEYTLYMYVHDVALEKGDTITGLLNSFTLKPEVTQGEVAFAGEEYNILVLTQAVQAEGVADTAEEALDAAFGKITSDNHPWGTTMDWYGDGTADTFYLTTASDLRGFAEKVTAKPMDFNNKTVKLAADIDLAGTEWTPIKTWNDPVPAITLDGNGYTIRNMSVSGAGSIGFIGSNTADWTIKNLTFENANVTGTGSFIGTVIGYQYGDVLMENVDVKNSVVEGSIANISIRVGGLVGFCVNNDGGTLQLTDCDSTGNTISGYHNVGGLVGTVFANHGPASMTNCTSTNNTFYYGGTYNETQQAARAFDCDGYNEGASVKTNCTESGNTYMKGVFTAEKLQAAIDTAKNGDTIVLGGDIEGDVTVTQKPDVKFTIDGNGHEFNGSIIVDGKSHRYDTAGLTIKNVNFAAGAINEDAYINLGDGTNNTRYTNHVTISNCTFTYTGEGDKVAIKSYTGGDENLTVEGCTVDSSMHSLLQVTNVEKGLTITGCKVYSKNGINLNNTPYLDMSGCEFDTIGYAVRFGVNGSTLNGEFKIADSTLKSACDDGDAVIIFRGNVSGSTLTLVDTTVDGTLKITNQPGTVTGLN